MATGKQVKTEVIDESDCQKQGALIKVVSKNDRGAVEALLRNPSTSVNYVNEFGNTALHYANHGDSTEVLQLLIDHPSIDTSIKNKDMGATALEQFAYDDGYNNCRAAGACLRKLIEHMGCEFPYQYLNEGDRDAYEENMGRAYKAMAYGDDPNDLPGLSKSKPRLPRD